MRAKARGESLAAFVLLIDADTFGHSSMRYSKMLEESAFRGRKADYLWLLIVSCTLLLVRETHPHARKLCRNPRAILRFSPELTHSVHCFLADSVPLVSFTFPRLSTLIHGKLVEPAPGNHPLVFSNASNERRPAWSTL